MNNQNCIWNDRLSLRSYIDIVNPPVKTKIQRFNFFSDKLRGQVVQSRSKTEQGQKRIERTRDNIILCINNFESFSSDDKEDIFKEYVLIVENFVLLENGLCLKKGESESRWHKDNLVKLMDIYPEYKTKFNLSIPMLIELLNFRLNFKHQKKHCESLTNLFSRLLLQTNESKLSRKVYLRAIAFAMISTQPEGVKLFRNQIQVDNNTNHIKYLNNNNEELIEIPINTKDYWKDLVINSIQYAVCNENSSINSKKYFTSVSQNSQEIDKNNFFQSVFLTMTEAYIITIVQISFLPFAHTEKEYNNVIRGLNNWAILSNNTTTYTDTQNLLKSRVSQYYNAIKKANTARTQSQAIIAAKQIIVASDYLKLGYGDIEDEENLDDTDYKLALDKKEHLQNIENFLVSSSYANLSDILEKLIPHVILYHVEVWEKELQIAASRLLPKLQCSEDVMDEKTFNEKRSESQNNMKEPFENYINALSEIRLESNFTKHRLDLLEEEDFIIEDL